MFDWGINGVLMNMLKSLKITNDQCSRVYCLTTCLILCCMIDISFIFKNYRFHNVFWDNTKQMEEKFKKNIEKIPFYYLVLLSLDPKAKLLQV